MQQVFVEQKSPMMALVAACAEHEAETLKLPIRSVAVVRVTSETTFRFPLMGF